eukprot:TRINITY_DN29394_c0_g1_i1.p1 TRINITY_DN29394_c0_g1~~TRINITY_DN29394_c0_g1_i1.p1  ORF type:complete len:355 (-),score=95.79 TRINITY_DN29394_c0_g1_i1:92-1156(-)
MQSMTRKEKHRHATGGTSGVIFAGGDSAGGLSGRARPMEITPRAEFEATREQSEFGQQGPETIDEDGLLGACGAVDCQGMQEDKEMEEEEQSYVTRTFYWRPEDFPLEVATYMQAEEPYHATRNMAIIQGANAMANAQRYQTDSSSSSPSRPQQQRRRQASSSARSVPSLLEHRAPWPPQLVRITPDEMPEDDMLADDAAFRESMSSPEAASGAALIDMEAAPQGRREERTLSGVFAVPQAADSSSSLVNTALPPAGADAPAAQTNAVSSSGPAAAQPVAAPAASEAAALSVDLLGDVGLAPGGAAAPASGAQAAPAAATEAPLADEWCDFASEWSHLKPSASNNNSSPSLLDH